MQILDVKFHEDEAYLYVMEKIGSVTVADNQKKSHLWLGGISAFIFIRTD